MKRLLHLKDNYGITCNEITPVTGGWLNRKWKVSTDRCELLVKQFSNKRYNKYRLMEVESALQRQIILQRNGVLCPYIWQYEGQAIRLMDDGTAYMVMDFHSGRLESPDTITIAQMRSLGSACGLMHKAFSQLPAFSVKGFPIDSSQVIASLWANFHDRKQDPSSYTPIEYRKAVLAQEPFIERYSVHLPLTLANIVDALRLSWCIEIPWWIQPKYFMDNREKTARFRDEMLWLTEHWFELDSFIC